MEDLSALEQTLVSRVIPWDRFSAWVHGVCVVTFDLELGQAIESVYPGHVQLSEQDKTNICYLAFPDSNSGVMGDSQFHFRVRLHQPQRTGHLQPNRVHSEFNRRCPTALQFDPNYLFGFAYFRQVKDSTIRRGYYQKSVILLSKLPLVTFFNQAVSVIARKFYDQGSVALEVACHDIDQWAFPMPGHSFELPLLGNLFQVHLPSLSTRSVESGGETVTLSPHYGDMLPVLSEVDIFTCLFPVIEHIHNIWELVLTAEPLVVMGSTPTMCSATVQCLTTIIYPLSYCADYRPFYTIHDSDFKDITGSNSSALPNIMLGVTNPFFGKALSHWPHLIRLGEQQTSGQMGQILGGTRSPNHRAAKMKSVSKFKLDSKPGVFSQTKTLLDRDKSIVKQIIKGAQTKRPAEVQSALIRRHFLELTQTFIIPLERYIASLMPLAKNISPYRAAPKVKPFSPEDFFASLESNGPQLTSTIKGDWVGLYRRFFKSPNFVGWYNQRHREVSHKLQVLHLECLSEATIEHWMADKEEVELVDMVLRIRNKLEQSEELNLPDIVCERLNTHVSKIVNTLPDDLQCVLLKGTVTIAPSPPSTPQNGSRVVDHSPTTSEASTSLSESAQSEPKPTKQKPQAHLDVPTTS